MTLDVFVILLIKLLPAPILLFSFYHYPIHSKIDYCNSILINLPAIQTNRLQLILNSAARAVTKNYKFHHITAFVKSLHWLKMNERIKYKVLSLASHINLKTGQPSYLHSLFSFHPHRSTQSSSLITLSRPSLTSRLNPTNTQPFYDIAYRGGGCHSSSFLL